MASDKNFIDFYTYKKWDVILLEESGLKTGLVYQPGTINDWAKAHPNTKLGEMIWDIPVKDAVASFINLTVDRLRNKIETWLDNYPSTEEWTDDPTPKVKAEETFSVTPTELNYMLAEIKRASKSFNETSTMEALAKLSYAINEFNKKMYDFHDVINTYMEENH